MSFLDDIFANNARFVEERERTITATPAKKIALFTCMDTRLVEFLEPAMGLRRGDAKVIKNAGTAVIDPYGGVIRSLVIAVHALGCEEIYIVGHLDCAMAHLDAHQMEQRMLSRGVPKEEIAKLRPSLGEWLGTFRDVYGNVRRVTKLIHDNPFVPNEIPVHGLMFDPVSGKLELLVNGYEAQVKTPAKR